MADPQATPSSSKAQSELTPAERKRARRKARKKRIANSPAVQLGIYLGLRTIVLMACLIPHFMLGFCGRILGRLIRLVARKNTRIARRNLELSEGIVTAEELPAFLDRVYDNLGVEILGILRIPRSSRTGELSRGYRLERMEVFDEALAAGKGCIAVLGHLGNYEAGGVEVCKAGYPLNSLARPIPNPYVEAWVTGVRTQTGGKIIPSTRAAREMLRTLRKNEILCVEIDIDAKEDGILVDFCGRPASTYTAFARVAIKCDAPLVVINVFNEGGVNTVRLSDPIYPAEFKGREDGAEELTRRVGARFDALVREHPEQWLWLLDRWRGADRILAERAACPEQALSEQAQQSS